MTVNLDKFQALLLNKRSCELYLNKNITIDKENIEIVSNVEILGVHIDRKLNFNLHIEIICKSASDQLDILCTIWNVSHFNYFPLMDVFK